MSKLQLEQWHVICKWNLETFFRWCFITLQSYGKSLEASNDFASYSWDNFLKSKFLSLLDIQNTSVLVWIWGWFLKQPKVHHLFSISFSMRSNEVTMNSNSCPHLQSSKSYNSYPMPCEKNSCRDEVLEHQKHSLAIKFTHLFSLNMQQVHWHIQFLIHSQPHYTTHISTNLRDT